VAAEITGCTTELSFYLSDY